jgi:Flp pilus assembly protein TadG
MPSVSDLTGKVDADTRGLADDSKTGKAGTLAAARPDRIPRFASEESGQALIITALCMNLVIAGMALAIDVGYLHYQQSQLQTAADSAAIAAGLELGNCSNTVCANMKTAAAQALIEDGITSSSITPTSSCTVSTSTGLAMTINVAPCVLGSSDPNNGNSNMAEVVLTESQHTFFGGILGFPTMNLMARAEAGEAYINSASGSGNCLYTKSLEFNSSDGTFTLNHCGIYDNGNLQTDNGDSVTASTFLYYGTWSPNNCNSSCTWTLGDSETQPTHTTTAQSDPLASLTPPTQPSSTYSGTTAFNSGTNNLSPGYYPSGFNINGGTVSLAAGVYYLGGSIDVVSGATLTGSGITLYFTSGSLQMNSNSTIQLSAPTTNSNGDNANMVVWESTGNGSGMTIDTGTSSYFNGIIYLPAQTLTLNSGSGVTINSQSTSTALDVNNMIVDDSEDFVINGSGNYLGTGSSSPTLGSFALAE